MAGSTGRMGLTCLPRRFMTTLRGFISDVRGASLVLVAASIIPMIGIVGLGVDTGRAYMVKARLGDALDAAGLAGAHEVDDVPTFQADVTMFFNANFPPGYMGSTVTMPLPTVSADGNTIQMTATATVPTTLMSLFGKNDITVAAATEVTRQLQSMDVAIAIDLSSSMNLDEADPPTGTTRLTAAKTATTTLLNVLFGPDATKDHLLVGVVPWNGKVNVFEDGTTITPVPLLAPEPAAWKGCVYARYSNDGNPANDADHLLPPVVVGGTDWTGWNPAPAGTDDECDLCSICSPHGITRLNNVRATTQAAIDGLTAQAMPTSPWDMPLASTNIASGLAWAWRVVTPGEPFNDADPLASGGHQRAIVLLTDGAQTGFEDDAYHETFGHNTAGTAGMNARLTAVADNIKAGGVKIYVIQFRYEDAMMKSVANEPNPPYYHFAADGADLNAAFQEVANHLSQLRLSK